MTKEIVVLNSDYDDAFNVETKPIECPYCHLSQIPKMYSAIKYKDTKKYTILCECCNQNCGEAFNVVYDNSTKHFLKPKNPTPQAHDLSTEIKETSPKFCDIYNEAYAAEQIGLGQIVGVGYRKALEFLIKDYLISLDQSHEEDIKKKPLGQCIRYNVTNENIKQVAERATWIGNDETHYVRKWENKDITDLKTLIDLTIYWIEAEIKTKKTLEDMPERENG
jgi:hypothetical protein